MSKLAQYYHSKKTCNTLQSSNAMSIVVFFFVANSSTSVAPAPLICVLQTVIYTKKLFLKKKLNGMNQP